MRDQRCSWLQAHMQHLHCGRPCLCRPAAGVGRSGSIASSSDNTHRCRRSSRSSSSTKRTGERTAVFQQQLLLHVGCRMRLMEAPATTEGHMQHGQGHTRFSTGYARPRPSPLHCDPSGHLPLPPAPAWPRSTSVSTQIFTGRAGFTTTTSAPKQRVGSVSYVHPQ